MRSIVVALGIALLVLMVPGDLRAVSQSLKKDPTKDSGENQPSPQIDFISTLTNEVSPECKARLLGVEEFPLLLGLLAPHAKAVVDPRANLVPLFSQWSSDLLLKIVLEIEQQFEVVCSSPKAIQRLLTAMRSAYLEKLGVVRTRQKEPQKLFRGLLAVRDEAKAIAKRIQVSKATSTEAIFKAAYASDVAWIGKVIVVGATPTELATLKKMLADHVASPSLLWDERVVYKVAVTSQKGIAAYVPELAQFVFSKELFLYPTKLNQIVLFHELVHSAERAAWLLRREQWSEEFAKFSGWEREAGKWRLQVVEKQKERQDLLTELSLAGSSFSILPDPLLVPKEKIKDGFVMAKTYRAVLEQGEVSEDLADHVAIFRLMPERFCVEGKNIAPQKAQWIKSRLFPMLPLPQCG